MTIDQNSVKRFWDERAKTYKSLPFESVAGLEQDPENLKLKIRLECEKVFGYLPSIAEKKILDLGAGVGQWAFRFVERGAESVTAVELSAQLVEIGEIEAAQRGVINLEFIVSPAEEFKTREKFDVVYISGLFVNINDDQAEKVAANIPSYCHPDTKIVLRDGTARYSRYELNKKFSDHLQTEYSAVYRTREEYIGLFARNCMTLQRDENVFYEGCALNKYPETRLRIYEFYCG